MHHPHSEIIEEHFSEAEGNSLVHIELKGVTSRGQQNVGVTITALTREEALILAQVCREVAEGLETEAHV